MLDLASKTQEKEVLFDPSFTISGSTEHSPRSRAAAASHGPLESGESTPPLWRSTSPARQSRYRSLSPASKAQAIARGQRELMEMVRTMPEGCYELSLRDMVEKPWARPSDLDLKEQENLNLIGSLVVPKEEAAMRKRSGSGGNGNKMVRSGSVEAERGGGFLLKMVFPVPVGSARNKRKVRSNSAKSKSTTTSDSSVKSKVSPKPSEDKDWWKRKIPILEESDSTKSSTSSSAGGGGSRRSNRTSTTRRGRSILPGCCSFFRPKKSEHPQPKNGLQEL